MTSLQKRPRAARGQGTAVREEILVAASALLAETGSVDRISLRAVAREVGVTPMALYRYFDDLAGIVVAVKLRHYEELAESLQHAVEHADCTPRARLYALAEAYSHFGIERPGAYQVLFSTPLDDPPLPHDVDVIGRRALDVFLDTVAGHLALSRDHPDTWSKTLQLWTAIHGITHLRVMRASIVWPDLDPQIRTTVDLLFP
ncbi:TetR/AcrR family transcriptional regulator [Antrihabitans cavernicola]|uniref:TetR/AcrR family transcriptional regulator n=1 Tax=Antrihabitans cavernicola TaxID=2495913 RepID=UPI001659B840|nr:TetR/AcrR family transcriptional regulator [Spelaeibacter cavernicola]